MRERHDPAEEQRWIEQVVAGDAEAFVHLVRRYEVMVRTLVAQRLGGAPDVVDETAQDVFLKAFEALGRFKRASKFSTWLYRIAVNQCTDVLRRRGARTTVAWDEVSAAEEARAAVPPAELADAGFARAVDRAWERLAPAHREILTLRELEDRSYEEIAEIVNCAIGTVDSRVFRARRALQALIQQEGV